ncbi:regulator of RNase E activity RraA [Thermocatellispora tengchongensis]|uniref:Putative 4-hydroxy-4-methyl-2-oxoglutarate aldolase n=1 Tax=Thermocatellispora tengchongensis TaxID=1073253 RepID=A0A840P5F4_9ACTN|nr:RraA family protein [Thermocatellispora tengchongensis]MBB5133776.1 regulator of RNase E activity RraA [Thermocatellispora tengchongensis]
MTVNTGQPAPAGIDGDSSNAGIAETELCDRYEQLFTAAVNDVLREKGLLCQALPPAILPLRHGTKVAGLAFTVKGAKSPVLDDEMRQRAEMLDAIPPNAVCVWDTGGDDTSAQWGEVMTMASRQHGCRGAVIDGGVRDTDRVLDMGFPIFCRYRTSNGMLGRFRVTDWQIPIRIAGVTIHPGDLIFGDVDGVIVVPRRLAVDVLLTAERVRAKEEEIKQLILDGLSPSEVVARGGYF